MFSRESTAEEVVDGLDLSGQVFVITGTTSGLGEESARVLAARGARIAMLARKVEANLEASDRIRSTVPNAELSTHQLDLSDLSSVESFAAEAADQFDRIDVLMNNAGVMCCPFGRTADGFEMQFGTNHLGHFALTAQNGKYLADCNVAAPGTGEIGYAPHIYNPPTEAALWELSERLVDLSF